MISRRLPHLERIEIRWHGWLRNPVTHEWTPIPQNRLLRRDWIFRDQIARLGGWQSSMEFVLRWFLVSVG